MEIPKERGAARSVHFRFCTDCTGHCPVQELIGIENNGKFDEKS